MPGIPKLEILQICCSINSEILVVDSRFSHELSHLRSNWLPFLLRPAGRIRSIFQSLFRSAIHGRAACQFRRCLWRQTTFLLFLLVTISFIPQPQWPDDPILFSPASVALRIVSLYPKQRRGPNDDSAVAFTRSRKSCPWESASLRTTCSIWISQLLSQYTKFPLGSTLRTACSTQIHEFLSQCPKLPLKS